MAPPTPDFKLSNCYKRYIEQDQFADQIAESGNTEFTKTVKQMKDAAKRLSNAER